jgi:two-component system chemotaxis response regulator CheY
MSYNVMVVDDSLPMRLIIKKIIRASGYRVSRFYDASDGKGALEILRKESLDLVVTDYNMPDMDGLELLKQMKNDERLKSIPVVVVSVEGSPQRLREFMDMGAVDFIRKPFTPEETREKLDHVLGGTTDEEKSPDPGHEGFDF